MERRSYCGAGTARHTLVVLKARQCRLRGSLGWTAWRVATECGTAAGASSWHRRKRRSEVEGARKPQVAFIASQCLPASTGECDAMRCGQRKLLPRPMRCSRVKPRETEGTGRGISANPILVHQRQCSLLSVQQTGGSQVHLDDGGNSRQAGRGAGPELTEQGTRPDL